MMDNAPLATHERSFWDEDSMEGTDAVDGNVSAVQKNHFGHKTYPHKTPSLSYLEEYSMEISSIARNYEMRNRSKLTLVLISLFLASVILLLIATLIYIQYKPNERRNTQLYFAANNVPKCNYSFHTIQAVAFYRSQQTETLLSVAAIDTNNILVVVSSTTALYNYAHLIRNGHRIALNMTSRAQFPIQLMYAKRMRQIVGIFRDIVQGGLIIKRFDKHFTLVDVIKSKPHLYPIDIFEGPEGDLYGVMFGSTVGSTLYKLHPETKVQISFAATFAVFVPRIKQFVIGSTLQNSILAFYSKGTHAWHKPYEIQSSIVYSYKAMAVNPCLDGVVVIDPETNDLIFLDSAGVIVNTLSVLAIYYKHNHTFSHYDVPVSIDSLSEKYLFVGIKNGDVMRIFYQCIC